FCRSCFSFFDAAIWLQNTREERNRKHAAIMIDRDAALRRPVGAARRPYPFRWLPERFGSHGPVGRPGNSSRVDRPQVVAATVFRTPKKRPRGFRGRLQFLLGKNSIARAVS